ncbi:hypothetical protein EV356DRAFT_568080 [Viridothelium virens]|uniref:Rhodopsin domain-containing protein n=1 Tax=Viridothelium virens TaxID=1048519 RepID=A0A6A6H5Y7_VIRVR|nr:hypothetical protein EV356DRAFT_568080 [Viridothelium virens]
MGGQEPPPNPLDNRQLAIWINSIGSIIVASIVVILRLTTRIWIVKKVGWDDYTIVLATCGHIIGMALVICELQYGFGLHRQYISPADFSIFQKYSYVEWIQTFQTLMFNKLSVCFFLLRLPVDTRLIRPIQWTIGALIISNAVLTFLWIFQCWPVPAAWITSKPATCFTFAQLQRIIISQAIISIISDFILALFPILLLWNVQISRRTKIGLCSLMALGLCTAGLCMVRTILNWENENEDPTWESVPNWAFRSWEVTVGITAACIPAMRPGYRVVSTSLQNYYSLLSSSGGKGSSSSANRRKASDDTLVNPSDKEEKAQLARELTRPGQVVDRDVAMRAAVHTASVEADRAVTEGGAVGGVGVDEELPTRGLRGDVGNGSGGQEQGIKKTMWFGTECEGSGDRSPKVGDLERGEGVRGFV